MPADSEECEPAMPRCREYCVYPSDEPFQRSREGYFGVYFEGNKHHNNTRVSAETVRHESTYVISFLTRHNESINDYKNDEH